MNIAHLDPPNFGEQGDYVYRTEQPCRALGQLPNVEVVSGTWLSPAMRKACRCADVLVINKVVDPDLLPLLDERNRSGLVTVFELNDDVTALHEGHPTRGFFARPDNRALLMQLARISSGLQFSSEGLARRFGHLNRRTAVFPNQLWEVPPISAKSDSPRVVVGWAGSAGHLADVASTVPVLLWALSAYPQLELAIMGSAEICALFNSAPQGRIRYRLPGSLADYREFLSGLDVGLAPLEDNAFNRGRSDVKILEYSAAGAVPLCAAVGPYKDAVIHGESGLLYDGENGLRTCLARLMNDRPFRVDLAKRAYARVRGTRLETAEADRRHNFYRDLAEALSPTPERAADFAAASAHAQSQNPDSRARAFSLTNAERHLYNGLYSQADPTLALTDWAKAESLAPDDYLVHLYQGNLAGDFAKKLMQAMTLSPHSCAAPYALGLRLSASGRHDEARQAFMTAVQRAPRFAPAHLHLGALREREEDWTAAADHYRDACQANPDFATPALLHAALCLRLGNPIEAVAILRQAEPLCEGEAQYWLLLGKALLLTRHVPEAEAALQTAALLDSRLAAAGELLARIHRLHAPPQESRNRDADATGTR